MITGLYDQLRTQEKKIQVLEKKNSKMVSEDELGLIFEKFDSRMIVQEQLIAKAQVNNLQYNKNNNIYIYIYKLTGFKSFQIWSQ